MTDLVLRVPAKVVYGSDVFHRAADEAARYGHRVLVVTESSLHDYDLPERLRRMLRERGLQAVLFDEIGEVGGTSTVNRVVSLARAGHVQVIVGFGGMRALAIARAAALAAPQENGFHRILAGRRDVDSMLPYIEVPTVFRNHFLLKDFFVITEQSGRAARVLRTPEELVRTVLFDPKLTVTMTNKSTAATMMDTLLAACEGYLSARSNFLSDTLFLRSIDTLKVSIDGMAKSPDDLDHRYHAADAGLLCAVGLSMSNQGAGGALTYAINSRFRVPKSWAAAILLPHILDFHAEMKPAKVAKIARALGEDIPGLSNTDDAAQASTVARRLIGKLGLPGRLREFELTLDGLAEASSVAASLDIPGYDGSEDELYELVRQAF
jgi:alcohol dehydrogenase